METVGALASTGFESLDDGTHDFLIFYDAFDLKFVSFLSKNFLLTKSWSESFAFDFRQPLYFPFDIAWLVSL